MFRSCLAYTVDHEYVSAYSIFSRINARSISAYIINIKIIVVLVPELHVYSHAIISTINHMIIM